MLQKNGTCVLTHVTQNDSDICLIACVVVLLHASHETLTFASNSSSWAVTTTALGFFQQVPEGSASVSSESSSGQRGSSGSVSSPADSVSSQLKNSMSKFCETSLNNILGTHKITSGGNIGNKLWAGMRWGDCAKHHSSIGKS